MNINKKTIISVFVIVLLVLGFMYFIKRGKDIQANNLSDIKAQSLEEFIFKFKENITQDEATVSVLSSGESLTLNYKDIVNEKLELSPSENGVRYTNADESIIFSNEGNEATIYQNDILIFQGKIIE